MLAIGKKNKLFVQKKVDFGVYLDGGEYGEILLPTRYVPEECTLNQEIEVFIYFDSEDRIIATTEEPKAQVGEFAFMNCVAVNRFGAFLDWGLMKDLLVPFREQEQKLEEGKGYVVKVYLDDESNRIAASAKIYRYINPVPPMFEKGEEVEALICEETEIGYKCIVNNSYWGMFFKNEVFKPLHIGDKVGAFVKQVREDGKIDLSLEKLGYEKVDSISQLILDKLSANDGFLPLNDKSPSEEISETFGISKKNFKKAIGGLYKDRIISIEKDGIRLI